MADPNYCYPLQILCQPLDWWSAAAAWAQALFAAVAIYAAAAVPRWQERRRKLDGADQFLHYTQHLIKMMTQLEEDASNESGRRGLSEWGHHAEWTSIAAAADELKLTDLPGPDFLPAWLQVREMASRCSGLYKGILSSAEDEDPFYAQEKLQGYLYRTKNLFNDLLNLDIKARGKRGFSVYKVD
ncbi:hypothetical protein [Stenotrophomonas sp. TWI819]|uniref:hypothetical protein n=1 Tax=Stenotrophomonas sp. TWI819 TaxID=3136800 RepID=UPI00320A645E